MLCDLEVTDEGVCCFENISCYITKKYFRKLSEYKEDYDPYNLSIVTKTSLEQDNL